MTMTENELAELSLQDFASVVADRPDDLPDRLRALARCHILSFTPELHTFYGDARQILQKMANVEMELTQRRMFLVAIESRTRSTLTLFEHVGADTWATAGRESASIAGYCDAVHAMIFDNEGRHCVGKSTQELTEQTFGRLPLVGNAEIRSDSGVDAFGDAVAAYANEGYTRVTVLLGC